MERIIKESLVKETRVETKRLLTVNDYLLVPNNGKLLQLIEGNFIIAPAPNLKHQEVSRNIEIEIVRYLEKNPIGKIFYAPVDYYIDAYNVVQPDLVYISKEKYNILFEKGIRNTPDLIIEIISAGTEKTDRELKKDLYWRAGVKEYWIVDLETESIEVYKIEANRYKLDKIYRKANSDKIKTDILPGFEINLDKVFYFDWIND